jgi:hypothetical protein
LFGSRYGSQYF